MSRPVRSLLLATALPLLAACQDGLAPLPAGAIPMEPLPVYAEWWRMTEQCSMQSGDLSRIEWFEVPGEFRFPAGDLGEVSGLQSGNRIVLAGLGKKDGALVRHEMLHAIIDKVGHPRSDFIDRCGLIVTCESGCSSETEAPPISPSAVWVSDSVLDVSIGVWPDRPSLSFLGGYFRVTVSARNPLEKPILVKMDQPADAGPPVTFQYEYGKASNTASSSARLHWPEMQRFNPGERKDKVFDLWVEHPTFIMPRMTGTYQFRGAYGRRWGESISVTIADP